MTASGYGIKNLQRIMNKLPEWTKEDNKGYNSLNEIYSQVVTQFQRYMGHVVKNIGGITTTPKTVEQPGAVVEFVSKAKQKEAISFLQTQLFTTPKWLIDGDIANYTGNNRIATIGMVQTGIIDRLLSNGTFDKLIRAQEENAAAYSVNEMVTDVRKSIYSELVTRKPIDVYRRNLQKMFAERLMTNMMDANTSGAIIFGGRGGSGPANYNKNSDAKSIARLQLKMLANEIKSAQPLYQDLLSKAHLDDLLFRINDSLDPK